MMFAPNLYGMILNKNEFLKNFISLSYLMRSQQTIKRIHTHSNLDEVLRLNTDTQATLVIPVAITLNS